MNNRERFIQFSLNKLTDRGVFYGENFWIDTLKRWKQEGMPDNYDFGFDFKENESMDCLGLNIGYNPPFVPEVLQDEGHTKIIRDEYGIIKRVKKYEVGMPQFLSFPVENRKSWEQVKVRLDPNSPGRFPSDWEERIEKLGNADYPLTFAPGHLTGFFSFLRELCGDHCYYLFYDEPELVHEILDFQVYRLTTMIRKVSESIKVDKHFIWEDMCFNKGSLISPELFKKFLLSPYQRVIEVSRQCGIQIIDVDSDGKVDELLPLWLEAGVTMQHPMEVAAGMDVVKVKKQYGDRLVIRGGIDKRCIAEGFDAIDKELERIRPAYEMGGYIPCIDHNVPSDISWDNYRYYLEKRAQLVGK